MEGLTWLYQWGGQLSSMAEQLIQKVPEEEEWNTLRHFLQNVTRMFRRGDLRAGARAFYKVVPFVQRALSTTEKVTNIHSNYDVTATISEHFLVDDTARQEINKFMEKIKDSIDQLRIKVEHFASNLDGILEEVLLEGKDVGIMDTIKLAFQMNRITAHIKTCEDQLSQARCCLDDLDTHVAGKTFLAGLLAYIAFFFGIFFSSTGQVPLGAACITAATASRKSVQGLQDYRKQLILLDAEHRQYQSELAKWKHNFRSEQINFLLLIGLRRIAITFTCTAIILLLLGKAANFMIFALFFMYYVIKSEEAKSKKYYAAMAIGVVAMLLEVEKHHGLVAFNSLSALGLTLCFMGFLEL